MNKYSSANKGNILDKIYVCDLYLTSKKRLILQSKEYRSHYYTSEKLPDVQCRVNYHKDLSLLSVLCQKLVKDKRLDGLTKKLLTLICGEVMVGTYSVTYLFNYCYNTIYGFCLLEKK